MTKTLKWSHVLFIWFFGGFFSWISTRDNQPNFSSCHYCKFEKFGCLSCCYDLKIDRPVILFHKLTLVISLTTSLKIYIYIYIYNFSNWCCCVFWDLIAISSAFYLSSGTWYFFFFFFFFFVKEILLKRSKQEIWTNNQILAVISAKFWLVCSPTFISCIM